MPDLYVAIILPVIALLLLGLAVAHIQMVRWAKKIVRRALRREKRAIADREEVVNFLNRFSSSIITSHNTDEWMWMVSRYLADVLNAQAIRIYLLRDKTLYRAASTGKLPETIDENYRLTKSNRLLEELNRSEIPAGEGTIGEVVLTGKSYYKQEFEGDKNRQAQANIESFIAVPLAIEGTPTGVICVINKRRRGQHFSSNDLFLLETLTQQVALGGTLITMFDELREQQRIHHELTLAQNIQTSLLPREIPRADRIRLHAINKPAFEVSGDYYDFFEIDDQTIFLVVADGSGKGVPACLLMTMCRSLVHTNIVRYRNNLEGFLRELNESLYRDTDGAQFITMGCCIIDLRDNTIEYARAGHTELLIRTPRGQVQIITPDGPALGILPNDMGLSYDTFYFSWEPGTSLLLFSDGITEAANDADEEFGLDRLIEKWQSLDTDDPITITSRILKEVDDFTYPCVQRDDQTLVVLSHIG